MIPQRYKITIIYAAVGTTISLAVLILERVL